MIEHTTGLSPASMGITNAATIMPASNGMTPIQFYMACKKDVLYDVPVCLALKLGMKWLHLKQMIATANDRGSICIENGDVNNRNKSLEQGRRDHSTGLYPFMLAAIHPLCDLESVYNLALYNVDNL